MIADLDLSRATLAEVASIDAACFPADLRYDEAEYRKRLARPEARLRGIRAQAGGIAAFTLTDANLFDPRDLFLDVLAVRPSSQGEGLGRKLILDAIEQGRRRGFRSMSLQCEQANRFGVDLVEFYARLGFSIAGREGRFFALARSLAVDPRDRGP